MASNVNAPGVDNRDSYRPSPGEIPLSPGVYRFSDKHGRVLYIGKAKNLRSRLSNYFGPLDALNPRTRRMLLLATRLDWTVVATDTESLILEHTWINEMEPPFNVQFRDDKTYPYLAVTLASDAPRLLITRNHNIKGARYFGPFPKVWALKETVALLQQAFPIRTCNDSAYKRALDTGVPCLASQIGRCLGPCSHRVSLAEHRERVQSLVAFLSGHDTAQLRLLRDQMQSAAGSQQYELAAKIRDQIIAAEHVLEKNTVVLRENVNADVFGLYADELAAAVHQFIVRAGRIRGERSWIVDVELDETPDSLMSTLLQNAYEDDEATAIPTEIIVSVAPADHSALSELLTGAAGRRVSIHHPERGEKTQIIDRALLNAQENLQRYKLKRAADIVTRTDGLAEIQSALSMQEAPLRIECIDISHLGGSNVVGSLVAFEDALPAKSGYRHFRIDNTTDDTDSIYQVVKRRFSRLLEQQTVDETENTTEAERAAKSLQEQAAAEKAARKARAWPQLLVVDGGQPQVQAANRALTELGITDVALCGIAKRLEEVWTAEQAFPIILPRSSEGLFLLQRIRDEAHRFAISYQRQRRSSGIASELADVPGLGEKRIQNLLRTFKSLKRVRAASVEELAAVPGISTQLAQDIQEHFNTSV